MEGNIEVCITERILNPVIQGVDMILEKKMQFLQESFCGAYFIYY